MVIDEKGKIFIFGGSGKISFMNDIFQIDTEEEEEE